MDEEFPRGRFFWKIEITLFSPVFNRSDEEKSVNTQGDLASMGLVLFAENILHKSYDLEKKALTEVIPSGHYVQKI